jgi:hypothetical protein
MRAARQDGLRELMRILGQGTGEQWQTLASNYYGGWGEENLEFKLGQRREPIGPEVQEVKARIIERQVAAAATGERQYHNGETLALQSWRYDGEKLAGEFVSSDYFTYLAYGEMEDKAGKIPLGCAALGVNFFVVTHDNMVIITERSQGVGFYQPGGRFFSFGETAGMGEVRGEQIDVVGCAVRGAMEELGLRMERGSFVFTSMGLNLVGGACSLLGVAYSGADWSELWLGDDRWERTDARAIPFRVPEVLAAMQEGEWRYGVQLGMLEALVYQYGKDAVWEAVLEARGLKDRIDS